MDEKSKQLIGDCFLRPLVDPKSSSVECSSEIALPSKTILKTELQVLRLTQESKNMIIKTLKSINGDDFQLQDSSKYKDIGNRSEKSYWKDRGTLIIQGGCDYSNIPKNDEADNDNRFRQYAIAKLETYGFATSHCVEAFYHCSANVDEAIQLLFEKYFPCTADRNNTSSNPFEFTENERFEMMQDEKLALQAIYGDAFEEKETNSVWSLKFKTDHLLSDQSSKQKSLQLNMKTPNSNLLKSRNMCRNFLKGHCKYNVKCRFSHEIEIPQNIEGFHKSKVTDPNFDEGWLYLEIRFDKLVLYPFEAPMIFLKTTCNDVSKDTVLMLTRKLVEESRKLASDGIPSVFSISEFIRGDKQLLEFLENDRAPLLDATKSLFAQGEERIKLKETQNVLATHYRTVDCLEQNNTPIVNTLQENLRLAEKFKKKQNEPGYSQMLKLRQQLPAWDKMNQILEAIQEHPVVVISGETGCGKSTQVPQFILDNWLLNSLKLVDHKKMNHIELICTQPRRLSTIGLAERIAAERNERVGLTIGYQVRLENKISTSTRLTFCTTGILLRRLQSDPLLVNISHVIVDEVHERSEESDFLLLILKEILKQRSDFRVILMSATLNACLFSNYFGGAPILEIPGRTFPVQEFFLEDILERTGFTMETDCTSSRKIHRNEQPELTTELELSHVNQAPPESIKDENLNLKCLGARYGDFSTSVCRTLYLMEPMRIYPDLIESVLTYVVHGSHDWPTEGTILIFLPGLAEIKMVHQALCNSTIFCPRANQYILLPLHSSLTSDEQALIFKKPTRGQRKIVLSTNIAETSVTIDDCVFVIDTGLMKETRFDANKNMESLDLVWVSRANAMQRKGRAGRVRPGIAIHLFTKCRYKHHILSQAVPEIHRIPLEKLLIRIKVLPRFAGKSFADVISKGLEAPTEENILAACQRLQYIGAFDEKENLTALGHHLSALPVDVRIGKLMLLGSIFQCVDSILTIAACLSLKSPFISPFSKKDEADKNKREFATLNSDHLTFLKAYKSWVAANNRSSYAGACFADEHYLSSKTLQTIVELKHEFVGLLVSIGFLPLDLARNRKIKKDTILEFTGNEWNVNGENNRLLAALLCAALYPNIVKVLTPEMSFTLTASGAIPRVLKPCDLRFKTREDGFVVLHPSSVNSTVAQFVSPYLIYQERVKTSRIFIRECTMLPLLPLVFFSGSDFCIERQGKDFVVLIDSGWILLKAHDHETAEMIQCLRLELLKLMEEKIKDPGLNLLSHRTGRIIITTIVSLISKP